MNIANIGVGVFADLSQLGRDLREGESAIKVFAGAAAGAFASVATAAIAAGLAIDDALDGIRISTGATGEALGNLEASFNRVFASVPSSAADVSAAMSQLNVRTGQAGVGLETLTKQITTLTRITKGDLNTNVTESAKMFQSWGIAVREQSSSLDMVLRTSQATGIGVGQLLQTMVTAGPVFRAAGYDFAETAALIGGFERAGVNGQRAVASLTAAFRFFAKEGINGQRGVEQTIARIRELGPGAASSALGVKVFGRSAVDMIAAIHSGRLDVEALTGAIKNGTETITTAAQATDGFTETLAKLRNNVVLALEPFGTATLKTFNAALEGVLKPSKALLGTLDLLAKATIALAVALTTRAVVALVNATRAKIADLLATQAARVAAVQYTAAVAAQAQAHLVAATAALNEARAETALTGSLVAQRAALTAVATAHAQATAAAAAHTAAINAASISARAAAASMNILKAALAFFGGPFGLAITALLTAVGIAFYNAGRKAREAAAEARQAAEEFRAALGAMDEATFKTVAATQRHNYGVLAQASAEATARLNQQRATVERLQREAGGADRFGEMASTPELREAQRLLELNEQNVAEINRQWAATAANVRSVREQEAALAAQTAVTTTVDPIGPLSWEGDKDGKRFAEILAEQVAMLNKAMDAARLTGADTTRIQAEIAQLGAVAVNHLSRMGDAAALSGDTLKDWVTLSEVIQGIRVQGGMVMGPAAPRSTQALRPALPAAMPQLDLSIGGAVASQVRGQNWGQIMRMVTENAHKAGEAIREGGKDAAQRLEQASEAVKSMWSGLLSSAPGFFGDFINAFSALKEARDAQRGAGQQVTGLAPIPGAAAFALAAQAIAPVLDALREPLTALLAPVQTLTQAFGPLLTSLVKAFFPVFKAFGIAVTYVAQVAGWVAGALLKVIGEIIRTIGSLISKVPGLGEEGNAIKKFGKGLTDASKEMFEMAQSMPKVRDELRDLDWDDAMKAAAESANQLADSLSNVPPIFDLIARRTQALRGMAPAAASPASVAPSPNIVTYPTPSTASQQQGTSVVHYSPSLQINENAFVVIGGDKDEMERQLRRFKEELITEMRMPGPNRLQTAVATANRVASPGY